MLEDLLSEPTKDNLHTLLAIYLVAVFVLLLQQWSSKRAIGLPMAYTFSFSFIYAVGAFIYGLPGYTPRSQILIQGDYSLLNTYLGFRAACFGYCFFVVGVIAATLFLSRDPKPKAFQADRRLTTQLPGTLLVISFLCFFGAPILRRIPSFGSMATAGTYVSVVAVFIYCCRAFYLKDTKRFLLGLSSTSMFPFITILFLGFAGYGAHAASTVWMFVMRIYRPRWLSLTVLALLVYGGLTFYVNWMREREQIRRSVWGEQTFEDRMESFYALITNFEFLNFSKQYHVEVIDVRLNQNDLAGKAIRQLAQGRVEYANGYTLWVAAVSWVPRILWPGKPATGGSGDVVTHFTGVRFAEGTSVGAGNVLELYANFGWYGITGGFFVIGFILTWFDRRAGFYFHQGDYWTMTRWALPGLGLIQPGGLIAEATGSCSAYAVFTLIVHYAIFKRYYDAGGQLQAARAAYASPVAKPVKPLRPPRYLE
ncbi:MAG: hypothetical protein V4662_21285 [Verrucomicrobiota bacterium]